MSTEFEPLEETRTCCFCGNEFPLGNYYAVHIAMCRSKARVYCPVDPKRKMEIVDAVNNYFRMKLPGVLIGYGE